ncbi:MAG: S-layer homology domain-containing protein [Clostridia bacterium]|nr:S-layer homology domain-containing protein [Clostridia bacterium]
MKFKYTRLYALLLLTIYIITVMPVFSFAEETASLFEFSFEEEGSANDWLGGIRDENCAFEGNWGLQVSNPFGDESTGIFGHILEYNNFVHLTEGEIYTFTAYVMNPLSDSEKESEASAYIGRNGAELFIDISSVGYSWGFVTASFMATEDMHVPLVITFDGGDEDIGFFIDSITLVPETRIPEYTVLEGPDSVFVPEQGFADYRYNLVTYDSDGLPINLLINNPDVSVENLPEGVEFVESEGKLRVYPEAKEGESFTITYSASTSFFAKDASITVTTTKNLLSDPSFEKGEENWVSDGYLSYADEMLSLYAEDEGDWGRYTSISYTKQLLLLAGNMYVFRADVGSDESYQSSSVYISNLSFADSGYAEINITGIGGEWSNITSAFMIADTGLYDLTINLYAPTERPIYIDNVYLGAEEEAPSSISVHAPGHIQLPSASVTLPCYATIRNQLGEEMDNLEAMLKVYPEDEGVYLEGGEITVSSDAGCGDYVIEAVFDNIKATHTVTVSEDAVGDGGFEEKSPDEWWTSSDGSAFSIIDYDGDKSAHIYSPDSTCLVINNSYMELLEGEYYVYTAPAGYGKATITAFIADIITGEYIPFAQYDPTLDTQVPFSFDRTVVGRLVLHIESSGDIGLIFDDIAIENAELTAFDVTTTGGEYGDFIRGSYSYYNNMTAAPDADISTTRWYISSSYDGQYVPIGVPNQDYLEFTPDMAGQFIVYEVTPVCAYSGLVGDSVRSLPLEIGRNENGEDEPVQMSPMTPIELESVKTHPFRDITAHWAESMIASLASAGVISGRSTTQFVPDYYVTRAEFTTMVARAFSLVSVPYSGKFDDIQEGDWYAGWVEAAYIRGIITGVDENTFAPNERITREQMATIVYRAYLLAKGPLPYDMPLTYYDSFMISPWAYESVKNCTNLNILTGKDSHLFKPQDFATRAEAAACLYRTLKSFY